MRHVGMLASLTLLFSACGAEPEINRPGGGFAGCLTATTPLGVDVSSYNTVNWATAAGAGISFGIAKATEGLTIQDDQFASNWSGMKANGVARGAYHFFHPGDDGTQQADYFLAEVGALGAAGDLPPSLDWEVIDSSTVATSIAEAQKFITEIQAKTGLTTIIYTYPDFWTSTLGSPAQFAGYPLWFANYDVSCPDIPAPWSSWLFWQYNDTGTVAGIGSGVDQDAFNGTLAQLMQLAGDGGITPPVVDAGVSTLLAQVSGNDALTLVNWTDGHMELFAKSPAGTEIHTATTAAGDTWSALADLGSEAECGSAAAFWGDPWVYPELFSPLTDGGTGHLWWTSGTGWNSYQAYGGSGLSHLSTMTWADGHVSAFALGGDGTIWQNNWDTTTSAWSGWISVGGSKLVTGAGTLMKTENQGELFATDSSGTVWHTWSGTGTGYTNGWYTWQALTGAFIASRPFPIRWPDDHVSVYARGTNGFLYFADFSAATPTLSPIDSQTQIVGDPSATVSAERGVDVFARTLAGEVVHATSTGTTYSTLQSLGAQVSAADPFGWLRGDGNAEVFAVDVAGNLVRSLREGDAGWQPWDVIGAGLDPCSPVELQADAGLLDAGLRDAGEDAGEPTVDAGEKADAGREGDAGQPPLLGNDAGVEPLSHVGAGCACGASGDGPLWTALLGLSAFGLRRRRYGARGL